MARWVRWSLGIVLALWLFTGVGCTMPDTACSATTAEPTEQPPKQEEPEPKPTTNVGSSGSVFDDQSAGFGVFPAFVPPIGLGGNTQECELGSDPYSTCI